MSRITVALKQQIVEILVERAVKERRLALKQAEFDFAQRVYDSTFSKETRDVIANLPAGWLPEVSCLFVSAPGVYENFDFEYPHRIPKARESYGRFDMDELSEGDEQCMRALLHEQKASEDYERELRGKIRGVLDACSTWKKLFAVWPESHDALKQLEPDSSGNLPAAIPQSLNEALGLP